MIELKGITFYPFRVYWSFEEKGPYGRAYSWSVETTKTGDFLYTDLSPDDEGRLDSSMDIIKKWTSGLQDGVVISHESYYLKTKTGISSAHSADKNELLSYYRKDLWEDAKLMKETTIISEVEYEREST